MFKGGLLGLQRVNRGTNLKYIIYFQFSGYHLLCLYDDGDDDGGGGDGGGGRVFVSCHRFPLYFWFCGDACVHDRHPLNRHHRLN